VEAEKEALFKSATSISDPKRVTLENTHFTSFRDHYLGQPVNGIRENIFSITADQVRQFHTQHYVGENIVVSAAGDVDFNKLTELVNNTFGKLSRNSAG
jgi:processing peptidase subunit beta